MLADWMTDVAWIQWVMAGSMSLVLAFLGWLLNWCVGVRRDVKEVNESVGDRISDVENKFTDTLSDLTKSVHELTLETKLTAKSVENLSWQDRAINELQQKVHSLEIEMAQTWTELDLKDRRDSSSERRK
jgi:phage host-nuclease inhibitor protein Gam